MTGTMHAAVLYGKEDVRLESVPIPEIGPGDLLVRVRVALTCGTDVKVFRRGYHARMIQPPALFGHEVAGDVIAAGDLVTKFRPGDRVVAANSAPCDACFFCLRGQQNLCEDLLFNNGAYAEYMRVPARIVEKNTYAIPPGADYRDAALLEPLGCVLRGLEESGVRAGDAVAVMGLGPIGLMLTRVAKSSFGARVIAIARRPEQIERAVLLGADEGVLMGESGAMAAEVRARTSGRGADVVVEAIGRPETWALALELARKGGVVNFFGGCPAGTKVGLDASLLHYSEIACKASFHHTPAYIRRALQLISRGEAGARHFVNTEESLAALPRVLKEMANGANHRIKTAIVP